MSEKFSTASWLLRTLRDDDGSAIADPHGLGGYYALAEDGFGEHCPYPLLPQAARTLFRARLALRTFANDNSHRRGRTWFFHCSHCGGRSFYTFRQTNCPHCESYYNTAGELVTVRDGHLAPACSRDEDWEIPF